MRHPYCAKRADRQRKGLVCFQQLSESCCADRGVSQIIWQSVERHRTSDSECPTTVSAETMSRNGQLMTCSRPHQMPTCCDLGDRDTTVGLFGQIQFTYLHAQSKACQPLCYLSQFSQCCKTLIILTLLNMRLHTTSCNYLLDYNYRQAYIAYVLCFEKHPPYYV